MNKTPILFSALLCTSLGILAQESKTYKETFNVGESTVLELNTSHADIEFETWDKDQVEIVATVTLDGADEEESTSYFKEDPITILGNSKQITVATRDRNSWQFQLADSDFDFHFDVEPLFMDLEIPDLPELAVIPELAVMPPMPPINFKEFDYKAYKKKGNKYLKEWAKSFEEGFDEEYAERMEEWGKKVEERAKLWEERNADRLEEREKLMEERAEAWEKRAEERAKLAEERAKLIEERNEARVKARSKGQESLFITNSDGGGSNIFFFSNDGESKKYKVKKTIKIKMPKSVRLKMNVKHGEVKLADITKDLKASLRYASLLAATIEGKETNITASYSPVVINQWNFGQLKADYSDKINLKRVGNLRLNSVSSNVVIERLQGNALVTNNLGKLKINEVANTFSDIDVSVQNGEVSCQLPTTDVTFYLNGTRSTMDYPVKLQLERTKNFDNVIYKGYQGRANSGKTIRIDSKYSEVVLKE